MKDIQVNCATADRKVNEIREAYFWYNRKKKAQLKSSKIHQNIISVINYTGGHQICCFDLA